MKHLKKLILFWVSILSVPCVYGQVDSLIRLLPNEMEDSVKIGLFDDICWELIYQDPQRMKEYADSMLAFANRVDHQKGIALANLNQGNYYMVLGQFQEASAFYEKAFNLSKTIGFLSGKKASLSNMATVHMQLGNFKSADSLLLLLDDVLEVVKDTTSIISNFINRSMLLGQQGKYEEAIQSLLRADELESIKDWGEPAYGISITANLGALYTEIGDFSKAANFYKRAIKRARELNHDFLHPTLVNLSNLFVDLEQIDSAAYYLAQVDLERLNAKNRYYYYADLAKIEEKAGNNDEALRNYQLALNEAKDGGFRVEEGVAYGHIGAFFQSRGQMEEAYEASKNALAIFRNTGTIQSTPYMETLINFLLAESYLDKKIAYKDLSEFVTLKDSMFGVEKINALSEIESKYENEKKQLKIDLLENEQILTEKTIRTQQNALILTLIGIGLITLLSFLLYRNRNKLKHTNREIIEQKNQIELLNREMNHRVKNNLAFMTGLLEMQGRRLENLDAKEALKESEGRLRALSLVHSTLFRNDGKQLLNIKQYLEQMLTQLQSIFEIPGKSLAIKTDIAELQLPPEQTMRIGLIVNELMTNSIKHAFAEVDEPQIDLKILQDEEKGLVMQYADNGPGIKEEILEAKKDSLGLKLIRLLVEQLGGRHRFEKSFAEFRFFYG